SKGEIENKKKVVQWLGAHLKRFKPSAYLATGGSTVNNLGTSASDLDLCICVHCGPGVDAYPEMHVNHDTLQAFGHYLYQQNLVTKLEFIPARVPILKIVLRYPFDGVHVDINCNCVAGIFNSHMLCYYEKVDERFAPLAVILKDWFKYAGISDSQNGYVNSYTVILMVVHYLQCAVSPPVLPNLLSFHPNELDGSLRVHELDFDLDLPIPEIPRNTQDLGELLLGFYEYWADFDYATWGVSIREARLFDRATYVSPVRDNPLAQPNVDGLFYMEEAYDFLTVPKNLKKQRKLDEITGYLRAVRDRFLSESDGYPPYLSHLWILDRYDTGN
ncbi:Protein F31C3.2 a, partial [Aphelenchoides avenae]